MSNRLFLLDSNLALHGPEELVASVLGLFPRTAPTSAGREHDVVVDGLDVSVDGALVHRADSHSRLRETLLMAINAVVVDDCTSFAVHAGVVARGGVAIAWPGRSGAGKSTLTAACLQAGLEYVSDEVLALQDGEARPYRKPLSLSAWSLAQLGLPGPTAGTEERAVAATELGGNAAGAGVRLGHLVVLRRRPGAPALEETTSAAAAMLLLEHSFNHYKRPERAFATAVETASEAQCWSLAYEDPLSAARLLADLVPAEDPRSASQSASLPSASTD